MHLMDIFIKFCSKRSILNIMNSSIKSILSQYSHTTTSCTPYASSFAGYKDWFIRRFRRPGYTVEAGLGQNPLPIEQFGEIYRDNIGILVTAALGLPE